MGGLGQLAGYLGGIFAVSQVVGWARNTLNAADAAGKLAAQLGVATDEMQALEAFTAMAGGTTEDLRGTLGALTANMAAAAKGGKEQKAAFEELGISTDSWAKDGLPKLWEALVTTGGALGDLTDETQRLILARKLMGETGVKLLPGFKAGTEAAREQMEVLKDLAVVYSEEFIADAEAANDEMLIFGKQLSALGTQILVQAVPHLRSLMREMLPVIRNFGKMTEGSNLLSGVLATLGATGLGRLITRFGGLSGVLRGVLSLLWRFAVPILLFDDLKTFIEGGRSALGQFLDETFGLGTADAVLENLMAMWDGVSGSIQTAWGYLKGDQAAIDEGKAKLEEYQKWLDRFASDVDYMFGHMLGESVWGWVKENHKAYSEVEKRSAEHSTAMIKAAWDWLSEFSTVQAERKKLRDEEQNAEKKAVGDSIKALGDHARAFRDWIQKLDRAWAPYERRFGEGIKRWARGIGDAFAGVWERALGSLNELMEKLTGIPFLGDLFGDKGSPASKPAPGSSAPVQTPAFVNEFDRWANAAAMGATPASATVNNSSSNRVVNYYDNSQVNTTVQGAGGDRGLDSALRRSEAAHVNLQRGKVQRFRQTVGAP